MESSTYSDTKAIKVDAMPGTTYWKGFPNPTRGSQIKIEILESNKAIVIG